MTLPIVIYLVRLVLGSIFLCLGTVLIFFVLENLVDWFQGDPWQLELSSASLRLLPTACLLSMIVSYHSLVQHREVMALSLLGVPQRSIYLRMLAVLLVAVLAIYSICQALMWNYRNDGKDQYRLLLLDNTIVKVASHEQQTIVDAWALDLKSAGSLKPGASPNQHYVQHLDLTIHSSEPSEAVKKSTITLSPDSPKPQKITVVPKLDQKQTGLWQLWYYLQGSESLVKRDYLVLSRMIWDVTTLPLQALVFAMVGLWIAVAFANKFPIGILLFLGVLSSYTLNLLKAFVF